MSIALIADGTTVWKIGSRMVRDTITQHTRERNNQQPISDSIPRHDDNKDQPLDSGKKVASIPEKRQQKLKSVLTDGLPVARPEKFEQLADQSKAHSVQIIQLLEYSE